MPGKKGLPAAQVNLSFESRFFPPGRLGDYHASGINQRRNARVGNAHKIPPVFDGPHRAEIEVETVARRVFPPAVVGDHSYKALFFGQVAGAVGAEYGFKADNR